MTLLLLAWAALILGGNQLSIDRQMAEQQQRYETPEIDISGACQPFHRTRHSAHSHRVTALHGGLVS